MVVYIASRSPLPLIPFRKDAPSFNVTELNEHEQPVRHRFELPHVVYAGSHTSCGCGFNEGREHRVEQIYSCWSGDEQDAPEFERRIMPEDLVAEDFFFRERELLSVHHETA